MISIQCALQFEKFSMSVDVQIPMHGITAIFGPSASGKTSLLRCIAGLDVYPNAQVSFGEQTWQNSDMHVPVHQRGLAYVFQEAGLFDHLTVMGNLQYAYKRRLMNERAMELSQIIELFCLQDLIKRRVQGLSGGEKQRVAIARALARNPRLLLMDEPLASLDDEAKQDILPVLEQLHNTMQFPIFYVSHSVEELYRLADHIVLLEQGRVLAEGKSHDLFTRLDLPLSHRGDACAIIDAKVQEHDEQYGLSSLRFSGGDIYIPRCAKEVGEAVRVKLAARDLSLTLSRGTQTSILNIIPAIIHQLEPAGQTQVLIRLLANGTPLLCRITRKSARDLDLVPGKEVYAQIKSVAMV